MVARCIHSKKSANGLPVLPIFDKVQPKNIENTTNPRMFIPSAFLTLGLSTFQVTKYGIVSEIIWLSDMSDMRYKKP